MANEAFNTSTRRRAIVVKTTGAIVVVTLFATTLCATTAAAQTSQQSAATDAARVHTQYVVFENRLRQAVRAGADQIRDQVRRVVPAGVDLVLNGSTEVTSYRLEDYGALFVVRVPGMSPIYSTWLRIQGQTGAVAAGPRPATPRTPPSGQGNVTPTALTRPADPGAGGAPPPAPFVDNALVTDPDGVYTREVQAAIIDAMLENGGALRIAPNERLIIAARDSAQPDPWSSQSDFRTLMFTIKGSDLSDYQSNKISREEAIKKVKITED